MTTEIQVSIISVDNSAPVLLSTATCRMLVKEGNCINTTNNLKVRWMTFKKSKFNQALDSKSCMNVIHCTLNIIFSIILKFGCYMCSTCTYIVVYFRRHCCPEEDRAGVYGWGGQWWEIEDHPKLLHRSWLLQVQGCQAATEGLLLHSAGCQWWPHQVAWSLLTRETESKNRFTSKTCFLSIILQTNKIK